MLETRKSITLTGNSYIETTVEGMDTKQRANIVYLSATVSADGGNISVNKTIQDKTLYLANKESCNSDMDEFETMVLGLIE